MYKPDSEFCQFYNQISIPAESVPKWVVNLATWVSNDKISTGEMIVAIEHIINN
jgi:hypothetical protein